MKKNQIIALCFCFLFCCGVLLSLYAVSPISKEIFRANFKRTFLSRATVRDQKLLDIEFNTFYFAGVNDSTTYLGNFTAPAHLLKVEANLKDSSHTRLEIIGVDSVVAPKRFKLTVAGKSFFMTHGNIPLIVSGSTSDWRAKTFIRDSAYYFVEALPITKSKTILKSYHLMERSYELGLKSTDSLVFNTSLLNKQIDGAFCVDGKLLYDDLTNSVVYVHLYRNEIIVTDTSLNLRYRTHTIDTFSRAHIKVSKLNSDGTESMISAPPVQLNSLSCVDSGKLYVKSNILASNEVEEHFLNDSVIDVYDLTNEGAYLYSFCIPSFEGYKPSGFMVRGNRLMAIFDHHLASFTLDETFPL